jgi:NTP pyrophosphatase (non-canonical NTP hydrolase)
MHIGDFQQLIERTYFGRDSARGLWKTFAWFVEEVGELSRALLRKDKKEAEEEFADVLAWLCTLASIRGIRMEEAIVRYKEGCPYCKQVPCRCSTK